MENLTTWHDFAKELGITIDELKELALEKGLIDEKGNPTQLAIDNGVLTPFNSSELN